MAANLDPAFVRLIGLQTTGEAAATAAKASKAAKGARDEDDESEDEDGHGGAREAGHVALLLGLFFWGGRGD